MNRSLGLLPLFTLVGTMVLSLLFSCSTSSSDTSHESDSLSASANAPIPVFTSADPIVKDQISGWLTTYFNLNQALISDSLAGAKTAATDLLATTDKFKLSGMTGEQMDFYFIQLAKLKKGLQVISNSTDIEEARSGLAGVSEAMYAVVKAFHTNKSPLYYQYCPMARNNQGANWLSATEELFNPYMGKMMLNCGRTQEKLD